MDEIDVCKHEKKNNKALGLNISFKTSNKDGPWPHKHLHNISQQ